MQFEFTTIGIILDVITFVIMILIVLFHFFVVNKNKTAYIIFHSYTYWLAIGVFFVAYFIAARWSIKIEDLINSSYYQNNINGNDLFNGYDIYNYSTTYSGAFLLDLCPAVAFLLPFSLIIDKSRSIAKVISPYAIIGSIITIYSTTLSYQPAGNVWYYIFLGESPNEMFFMMHFNSLVIAIGVMLTSKKYTRYSVLGSFVFICLYIGYVKAFVDLKGVVYNTTGVSQFDWYDDVYGNFSEYGIVYMIFPISFPAIQIIAYIVAVVITWMLMLIKNYSNKDINKVIDIQKYWYQNIKFINRYLYLYDLKLNIFCLNLLYKLNVNVLSVSKLSKDMVELKKRIDEYSDLLSFAKQK